MAKAVVEEVDPLSLERQVCFALAITNRAVLAVYRPLLEPLGLTHPQYLVMLALWDNAKAAGEPLSVKDIARLLQMGTSPPVATRLHWLPVRSTRSWTDDARRSVPPPDPLAGSR